MPLHKRESLRDELIDSVYADQALKAPLPSTHCPNAEMEPTDVMQAISDELMLDGNARQNLATFCQTWEEPQVHQLMDLCIDKNLIDKDEYPQTAELERRCVRMLAGLWNAPEKAQPIGCSAIGSSEACIQLLESGKGMVVASSSTRTNGGLDLSTTRTDLPFTEATVQLIPPTVIFPLT